jgi:peptidoglycan/xylan/chitin deacetylase (PgdA/CDA1 family)
MSDGATWRRRCVVTNTPRALRDLGSADTSLRKGSNRSRLNRLALSGGDIRFDRVTDATDFARALDEICPLYDLRQGALHDVTPFAQDPLKRAFHEALFARGLLHVTTLRAGDSIVAAHVGVVDGDRVGLGVFAHSPVVAKQSPGKLHLHALARHLRDEGFATLDLTPGGGWKERFATRVDEVPVLTVHFRVRDAAVRRLRLAAEGAAKRAAIAAGTTPAGVRSRIAALRALGVRGLAAKIARRLTGVRRWFGQQVEYCLYTYDVAKAAEVPLPVPFAVNRFADLVLFTPMEPWQTRRGFFAECLERLSRGDRVYTHVEDGRLLSYGWLRPVQARSYNSEVRQEVLLPPGAAVAYDYHTHPLGRGRGLHKSALATALRDAASLPTTRRIWTGVAASNGPSRHNCDKMGWRHHCSLWMRTRFGRVLPGPARRSLSPALGWADHARRVVKRVAYTAAKWTGLFRAARRLTRDEMRILCYHGFERDGESAWGPKLFMREATFARRMETLARSGHPVVPLSDAVRWLDPAQSAALPPAPVVVTLDDGASSAISSAVPVLSRLGFPATFYATSYYVQRPAPVFRVALQYAFWRSDAARLALAGLGPFDSGELDLRRDGARELVVAELIRHGEDALDEPGRAALLRETARRLGVDLAPLEASRVASLMTPDEVRALAAAGFDVQLHTHRHRFSATREETRREVEDNRAVLEPLVGRRLTHLCYPSNECSREQAPWLGELGIESGATCNLGLNPRGTPLLGLRRFLDGDDVAQIEFEAEVSGFAELCRRAAARLRALPTLLRRRSPAR